MKKSIDLRHGRACVFAMHVHLVFVTNLETRATHLFNRHYGEKVSGLPVILLVLVEELLFQSSANILKINNH